MRLEHTIIDRHIYTEVMQAYAPTVDICYRKQNTSCNEFVFVDIASHS